LFLYIEQWNNIHKGTTFDRTPYGNIIQLIYFWVDLTKNCHFPFNTTGTWGTCKKVHAIVLKKDVPSIWNNNHYSLYGVTLAALTWMESLTVCME